LEEKAPEMKDGFINASRKYMGSLSNLDNGIFDQAQHFTGLQPTLCIRLHSLAFLCFPNWKEHTMEDLRKCRMAVCDRQLPERRVLQVLQQVTGQIK
jgi:hypothetical protein